MFDIAAVPFEGVPPEEMKTYVADMETTGEYEGYKPMQYWVIILFANVDLLFVVADDHS